MITIFWSLKETFYYYYKIFPLLRSNYLVFFFKIFSSKFFVRSNPVSLFQRRKLQLKYNFKYPDWFGNNINIWKKHLKNLKNFKYLEIGTFEGRSALFVKEFKNCKNIICVDPYINLKNNPHNFSMQDVYNSVRTIFAKIQSKKIKLLKKKSNLFFLKNKLKFDVIYIDGDHGYKQVKKDFNNSMKFLEKDGILIFDDFYWFVKNKKKSPCDSILECFEIYKNELKIIFIDHQIIFKRK
jgi:predicted O-methyltransferase YrrM